GRGRALPGVSSAGAGTAVPLSGTSGTWDFLIEGRPAPGDGEMAWNADVAVVRPGYFETLGIRLLQGRGLQERDDVEAAPVTVINERMARTFFGDAEPLGQRIAVSTGEPTWMTVVGVVEDVRYLGLADEARPVYYLAHAQTPRTAGRTYRGLTLFLETRGDPATLAPPLRELLGDLDPELPLSSVATMPEMVRSSTASERFTTVLLSLFAVVAVALGTTGVYGVLAYAVARRTREIGIRKALGAPHGQLVRRVVGQAMVPVAAGLALGALSSVWATRLLERLLFEIEPSDPATYVGVGAVLLAVSLAACLVPVRRALAVDALEALRVD
ncbi:MAG: FtsX-like permease family protein, partial [Acidobacteriota bacterium]